MTNKIDYSTIEIPDDEPPEEYHYTARRAELLEHILREGSPSAINQSRLAERFDVTQGQISQDVDALGEHIADGLGGRATLETRAAFERIRRELFDEGEWKDAWEVIVDWNEWLADMGEQHREPDRSELDVDVRSRHSEVAYQVVREGENEPLPTTEVETDDGTDEQVDHEALGFTSGPVGVEVTPEDTPTDE